MAVTIKDIAKETGFSLATISFVLNDKKTSIAISDSTKTIVKAAADRLGYQPNHMAQALRRQKSNTIGVVFGTNYRHINDPVIADILGGVGAAVDATDYELHLLASYEGITERSLKAARSKLVDGIIYFVYSPTFKLFNNDIAPQLRKSNVPYQAIQFYSQFEDPNCVRVDVAAGTRKAVQQLVDGGCKSVGLVVDSSETSIAGSEITEQFHVSVAELGIKKQVVHHFKQGLDKDTDPATGRRYAVGAKLADMLVESGQLLDGYFFFTDITAGAFIETLQERGVDVPGNVKVIGFGNLLNGHHGSNRLTTVDGCYFESGRLAGETLLGQLDKKHEGTAYPEGILLEPALIIRKTA